MTRSAGTSNEVDEKDRTELSPAFQTHMSRTVNNTFTSCTKPKARSERLASLEISEEVTVGTTKPLRRIDSRDKNKSQEVWKVSNISLNLFSCCFRPRSGASRDCSHHLQDRTCSVTQSFDKGLRKDMEIISFADERKLIARSRTSTIFEIALPEDMLGQELREEFQHNRLENWAVRPCAGYRFAVKLFNKNFADHWESEIKFAQHLSDDLPPHASTYFSRYLCAFTIPREPYVSNDDVEAARLSSTRGIIMELAHEDLGKTLSIYVKTPSLKDDIEEFWSNLCGITKAVNILHNGFSQSSTSAIDRKERYFGYHHDIKPSNILLCGHRFKLADFGCTAFVREDDMAHMTNFAGGTISYGSPEASRPLTCPDVKKFLQAFDLWSLGCVFSEAATWVVLGPDGVKKFRRFRSRALNGFSLDGTVKRPRPQILGGDMFHDGEAVLDVIKGWHKYLRGLVRVSDTITSQIIDVVDEFLLVRLESRINAAELSSRVDEILKKPDKVGESEDAAFGASELNIYFKQDLEEDSEDEQKEMINIE